ncbi:MAG TPA: hypothetical protein EYO75_08455 [Sulfurimonas sp.]|nr:hypothetical protein [Sulfurimonas sp.]HIM76347.1 hypothetical protein [Campylobacterales bacterium]
MAEQKRKRYLELQMEELKEAHADNIAQNSGVKKVNPNHNAKNAAIAEMYNDAAEYEADLKCFEDELFLVNKHSFADIATEMHNAFPKEDERDFLAELNTIVELGWTDLVEVQKTHPLEQLELIKATDFTEVIEVFNAKFPDYTGDFEAEARVFLAQRWERIINIKKEHIKQELYEINTSGLKAKYVKRVYQKYHGLV